MKPGISIWAGAVLLLLCGMRGFGQGFVNLNFEAANLSGYPPGSEVPAANAFQGWTVSAGFVGYDDIALSAGSVSIVDTNSATNWTPFQPIQGKYFALFTTPEGQYSVSLGQTGTIPVSTESMTFWGAIGDIQITFNGQPLSFETIGSTANYSIYVANISEFAGETGQLLFIQPPYSVPGMIDNIQFSSSPVPEPGGFALAGLAALFLGFRCWRQSSG